MASILFLCSREREKSKLPPDHLVFDCARSVFSETYVGNAVTVTSLIRSQLLLMPREQHVSLTFAAGVVDQCKGQSVGCSAELVNTGALTAFRSFPGSFLNRDPIAGDRVIARDVAFRIYHIERAVAFNRPDGVERVGPCSDKSSRGS